MRAMVYTAPLELQILDVPEPAAADGEALLRVRTAGICGSELEGIRSRSPFRVPPLVMGHEFGAERVDTGAGVVVNPLVSCGTCDLCLLGTGNLCRTRAIVGVQRPGAFAELVAVPERNIHEKPAAMSWEQAALVEPLANAVHAWRLVAERAPGRVGIIGAGTIGLVMLLIAQWRGALDIDVADLSPGRLEHAKRMGATNVGPELTGEYDVVFDAVGAAPTRKASVELVRPGGAAVWIGLHSEDPGFGGLGLIRTEKAVFGSFAYTDHDFRQALRLAETTDASWVTSYPLEDGVEIFTELMNGRTDIIKAQLVL